MRFPALAELDREQRRIYADAPTNGAIVVVGAPGTGKTIMAFHRARKMRELELEPQVIMFGSVLERYVSCARDECTLPVSTMHRWAREWWLRSFRRWPPRVTGSKFDVDWVAVASQAMRAILQDGVDLQLGHLIVDEGQDFPPEMYMALGLLVGRLPGAGLTVFADDNQRLELVRNSETGDIRRNLFVEGQPQRNFVLRRNFRNTRQVAAMAGYFQVGHPSGRSEPPERDGDLPVVLLAPTDRDLADFLCRKAKASPGRTMGVVVRGPKRAVSRTYNQMASRLAGSGVQVQMYLNGDARHPAGSLDFASADTVTVLHERSAKGLEFDVVAYVGIERIDMDASGGLNERMALYVMCSRARAELILAAADLDPDAAMPHGLALLPPPAAGLCRYVGLGKFTGRVDEMLGGVEWRGTRTALREADA